MASNIVLEDALVSTAMRLSRTKTKRKVADLALRELVARYEQRKLGELVGQGLIDSDYDIGQVRRDMDRGSG